MTYAFTISGCGQVGVNEWRDWHKTAVFSDDATIAQINDWIRANGGGDKGNIMDAKISSVEDKST